MTAANPKAPFTMGRDGSCSWVDEAGGATMAYFYGPDRVDRAEALAAEYEQTYGPEWVVDNDRLFVTNTRTGANWPVGGGSEFRAHICRLLNEHGGPQ